MMKDKNILITGATSGIGRSAAIALSKMGANISFIARGPEKAQELQKEIKLASNLEADSIIADLSSLEQIKQAANEFKTKNRLYISLAGIFTYYNFQLGRAAKNKINLYLYMGIKGCELTWIKGGRILYNRTILISNQAISEASYLSEAIPRIIRTIKVSLEELKRDDL